MSRIPTLNNPQGVHVVELSGEIDIASAPVAQARLDEATTAPRADSTGSAKAFLTHIQTLREHGLNLRLSVGLAVTEPVRRAIRSLPEALWHPALDQNGTLRGGAEVAELASKAVPVSWWMPG
ncbi:hypothetical protein [Streptomyces sp. bgisy031]|uniref:hypothetical protein n=1 Tax=Streptomyces sp. bgisy031 TaxID=3413772 RepID=UPI003D7082ED